MHHGHFHSRLLRVGRRDLGDVDIGVLVETVAGETFLNDDVLDKDLDEAFAALDFVFDLLGDSGAEDSILFGVFSTGSVKKKKKVKYIDHFGLVYINSPFFKFTLDNIYHLHFIKIIFVYI